MGAIPFVAVALPCWGFAGMLFWHGVTTHDRQRDGVSATCTVIESAVKRAFDPEDGSTTGSYAVVTIAHEVDGRRYERRDSGGHDASESASRAKAARYPAGAQVPCHHAEDDPADVWVFEAGATDMLRWFAVATAMFLLPLGLLVYWRAGSRQERRRTRPR
jgi:hypothetical protein